MANILFAIILVILVVFAVIGIVYTIVSAIMDDENTSDNNNKSIE